MSNYDGISEDINIKKFLLDMLAMSEKDNFRIGSQLREQGELLNQLADIAWKVGHIKQSATGEIFKLVEKYDIDMDINKRPREYEALYFGKD